MITDLRIRTMHVFFPFVIPAKAGIQSQYGKLRIPFFKGMTNGVDYFKILDNYLYIWYNEFGSSTNEDFIMLHEYLTVLLIVGAICSPLVLLCYFCSTILKKQEKQMNAMKTFIEENKDNFN